MSNDSFPDPRNLNSLWAGVLVETLVRTGVRHAVISPGSRSTALAFAFARHSEIEAIPVLDERTAGFFALGLAKRRLQPVVPPGIRSEYHTFAESRVTNRRYEYSELSR